MRLAMIARPLFPLDPARAQWPIVAKGEGMVLAIGAKPVRVTYELLLESVSGEVAGRGTLHARRSALQPMWLEPIVMLRTEDGQHIDISITEFDDVNAAFEIVSES
jgi:hypothetical protein